MKKNLLIITVFFMTTSYTLLTGQPLKPIFEKINANVLGAKG